MPVINLTRIFHENVIVFCLFFFYSAPSFTARLTDVNNKGNILRCPKGCTLWLKVSDQWDLPQFSDFGVSSIGRNFIVFWSIHTNEVSKCALFNYTPNSVIEFMI